MAVFVLHKVNEYLYNPNALQQLNRLTLQQRKVCHQFEVNIMFGAISFALK